MLVCLLVIVVVSLISRGLRGLIDCQRLCNNLAVCPVIIIPISSEVSSCKTAILVI